MQTGEVAAGFIVLFLGALAGAGELMSRYRDAPWEAIRSLPGSFYLFLNGGVSLLAFACLRIFANPVKVGDVNSIATYVLQTSAAGFGAMALLRTSFFNVRIGDKDVGLGPGLVLQVILDATDREVDRSRAQSRSILVQKAMRAVSFAKARTALPTYCAALMQNLSDGDQKELAQQVENLSKLTVDDETLALILGVTLMNFVGGSVLERAVEVLGPKISRPPSPLVQAVAPAKAQSANPGQLTITGSNFQTGAAVWVNGAACSNIKVASPASITCDAPAAAGTQGLVAVTVANPDGQSVTVSDKLTYT